MNIIKIQDMSNEFIDNEIRNKLLSNKYIEAEVISLKINILNDDVCIKSTLENFKMLYIQSRAYYENLLKADEANNKKHRFVKSYYNRIEFLETQLITRLNLKFISKIMNKTDLLIRILRKFIEKINEKHHQFIEIIHPVVNYIYDENNYFNNKSLDYEYIKLCITEKIYRKLIKIT